MKDLSKVSKTIYTSFDQLDDIIQAFYKFIIKTFKITFFISYVFCFVYQSFCYWHELVLYEVWLYNIYSEFDTSFVRLVKRYIFYLSTKMKLKNHANHSIQ